MSNAERTYSNRSYNHFHQGAHCYGHFPMSSPGSRIYHHASLLLLKLSSVSKRIVMSANRWSRWSSSWSLGCSWLPKSSRLRGWSKWRPFNDRGCVSWTYTEQYHLCEPSCPWDLEDQCRSRMIFWYVEPWTLYFVRAKAGLTGTWNRLTHILPAFVGKEVAKTGIQSLLISSKGWCLTASRWNKTHIGGWVQRTKVLSLMRI